MARRIVAEFDAVDGPFLRKLNRIDRSINNFERKAVTGFSRVERGIGGVVTAASRLRTTTAVIAGGFGVNLAAGFLDQAKLIRNALREAGDTSEETFERVFRASVRSLSGFKDFTVGVQRFQKALSGTQGIQDSIRQIETLNKLLALSGKSSQERQSTFIQFSQALQSGYLGGEELRAVRENAPIELTRAIAREAGGTISSLKDLGAESKLTTEVMIRALKSLEAEADARFGNIQVTISDASKVFASGAVIVSEAFDKGLGLSETTVKVLKTLGETVGENAEAFEIFGKSARVAGAALIASFAGRKLTAATDNMRQLSLARIADANAADRQLISSRRSVAAAVASRAAARDKVTQLVLLGRAQSTVDKANNRLAKADVRLAAARRGATNAIIAQGVAHERLVLSTRALTGAGNLLRGAFRFMGGWVGVGLTLVTVFASLKREVETSADVMNRIAEKSREINAARDTLLDVQNRLNDAIKAYGENSTAAARAIVASTEAEFDAKQKLLGAEQVQLFIQRAQVEKRIEELTNKRQALVDLLSSDNAKSLLDQPGKKSAFLKGLQEGLRETEAELRGFVESRRKMNQDILNLDEILGQSFEDIKAKLLSAQDTAELEKAMELVNKFVEGQRTSSEKAADTIISLTSAREKLVAKYGEEHSAIVALDEAMHRFQTELDKSEDKTVSLTKAASQLRDALQAVSSVNVGIQGQISIAEAKLRAAQAGASENRVSAIGQAQEKALGLAAAGASPDQIAAAYNETVELNEALSETNDKIRSIFNPPSAGGSGGTTVAALTELEKEAVSAIESMLTAEERRAQQIQETIALRQTLLAQYGQETELTLRLAGAIDRMKEATDSARDSQQQLFEIMSDNIASSVDEWKGWGSFIRNILADLVRAHGVDFFTALLTPGLQTGGSLGTNAGNWLAGIFHEGGEVGQAPRTRNVPASTFIGAPRFHNGLLPNLKSNEFPAILERGEIVIPKHGVGKSRSGPVVQMFNDFRGADASMRAYIEGRLNKMETEFDARVLAANRRANSARIY